MTIFSELRSEGWHLSDEGLDLCSENGCFFSLSSVIKKALDMDLREIGDNFLPEELAKGKAESISGPAVLQIQKIKNASAPKYEYGTGAPPILRLLLTDGNNYINCLQWGHWKSISLETPPGTKIYLKPVKIPMQSNFLLLSEHQFTVLGGCVAAMVEKWDLNRKLASHIRTKENLDGTGPPPWTPFGQQILRTKSSRPGNFRALESEAKVSNEDAVFKQQRQANIAEVARVKETKSKSFGGRKEKPLATKQDNADTSYYNHSNTYANNDYESRRVPDSAHNSPAKSRQQNSVANDRTRRGGGNGQSRQQEARFQQQPGNNSGSMKDGKLENRTTKLGDFITHDIRQRSTLQTKPANFEQSGANISKQHKAFVGESSEKQPVQNLRNNAGDVIIFGYDGKSDRKNFAVSGLKQGMEVMARYWEDNQFYRAVVHAVGSQGTTCVVYFSEYGNFEEVMISDVNVLEAPQERKNRNWNAGPISFQPSPRVSYDNYSENQNHGDASNYYQSSNRAYGRRDTQREYRQRSGNEYRSSNKFHHPPNQRNY